jgi:hypothetical protein
MMSDTLQYIIVGIVVAIAFALTARSIYRLINNKKSALNPCDSCKLKDNCLKLQKHTPDCTEYRQIISTQKTEK